MPRKNLLWRLNLYCGLVSRQWCQFNDGWNVPDWLVCPCCLQFETATSKKRTSSLVVNICIPTSRKFFKRLTSLVVESNKIRCSRRIWSSSWNKWLIHWKYSETVALSYQCGRCKDVFLLQVWQRNSIDDKMPFLLDPFITNYSTQR